MALALNGHAEYAPKPPMHAPQNCRPSEGKVTAIYRDSRNYQRILFS